MIIIYIASGYINNYIGSYKRFNNRKTSTFFKIPFVYFVMMLYPTNLPNMSFVVEKYKQQEQSWQKLISTF